MKYYVNNIIIIPSKKEKRMEWKLCANALQQFAKLIIKIKLYV